MRRTTSSVCVEWRSCCRPGSKKPQSSKRPKRSSRTCTSSGSRRACSWRRVPRMDRWLRRPYPRCSSSSPTRSAIVSAVTGTSPPLSRSWLRPRWLLAAAFAIALVFALSLALPRTPKIPRVWDKTALENWATPLAGLNQRPTHMSAAEYYAIPEENLRTYPVYMPEREPAGYWETLLRAGPQRLIDTDKIETDADWVAAGKIVFFDSVVLRTFDAHVIATARDQTAMEALGTGPLPDGTINGLRWVPTQGGVALGFTNCSACHLLFLPDNTPVPGASSFAIPNSFRNGLGGAIRAAEHTLPGETPFSFSGPIGSAAYQAYGVPWIVDPAGERLRDITQAQYNAWIAAAIRGGG